MSKKPKSLNPQGLSRRDKKLMSSIIADPGQTLVSEDVSAGEPSVTAHFSQDTNYKYACFDGVGKAPVYKNGLLMIDDIYLMVMSKSPIGKDKMWEVYNTKFNGKSFQEQWLEDSDYIKSKVLKNERAFHKMLGLALGYNMQPKKMVKQSYNAGHVISLETAAEFYKQYWEIFSGVRKFSNRLARRVEEQGWLVNPFGFRCTPEPHKAFNAFIQSSVSGLVAVYNHYVLQRAPYATFVTIIHDEIIYSVPDELLEDFRRASELAAVDTNDQLKWSVKVRFGFAPGKNLYEAK